MGARDAGIVLTLVVAAVAAPLTARGAGAPEPDSVRAGEARRDSVLLLPEVEVESDRPSAAARRMPTAFVTEIAAGSRGGALDLLPELLSQAPGVHVTEYGGLGAFSSMTVRAASPAQVAVFIDGAPLTSAARPVVNLADLPVAALERVEVYRGASPFGFGMAGAGGAINLVTRQDGGPPELEVSRGSFDTWQSRGAATLARGPVSGLVLLGYQGSAGDFRYFDDNGTAFNAADDSTSTRANNRFDAVTGLGRLTWRPWDGVSLMARGDLFEKRQGLPGLGAVPTRHARLELERALGQLEVRAAPRGPWPRLALRGGVGRERNRFRDPGAELGLGTHRTDDRFHHDHLDLELEWEDLPWALAFQAGGTARGEEARLSDPADGIPDPPPSHRQTRGATAGLSARPLGGKVVVRAAKRWDRIEDRMRALAGGGIGVTSESERTLSSPQLGLGIAPGWGFELRGNWSKAERPPSFLELFGDGGMTLGNPRLLPEHVESWDGGALWVLQGSRAWKASASWAHFETFSRDLIHFTAGQGRRALAMNLPRATGRGEEVSLDAAFRGLRLTASMTWQSVVDAGDVPYWAGRQVPLYPIREHYARLSWQRDRVRLGADLHAIGENYIDRYNRSRVPGRTLVGAWASFAARGWPLGLTLEGKNLGDERAADVAGYPLPGRSMFLAVETRPVPRSH